MPWDIPICRGLVEEKIYAKEFKRKQLAISSAVWGQEPYRFESREKSEERNWNSGYMIISHIISS